MKHILIVDDELPIREWLKAKITEAFPDYTVKAASNGKEALALARLGNIDMIFTDIRMPVMNGLELVKAMQSENIESEIFVLTSYDEFDYARSAFQSGVKDYILKTEVTAELLIKVIKKYSASYKGTISHPNTTALQLFEKLENNCDFIPPSGPYFCFTAKNGNYQEPTKDDIRCFRSIPVAGGIRLCICELEHSPSSMKKVQMRNHIIQSFLKRNPTSIISFSDVQEEPSLFLDQLKKTYTSLGLSFYTNDQAIPAQSHSEIIYTKLNYAYLKLINAIQKNQQEQQQSNFDAFNSVLKELRPPDIDYVKNLYKKIHDALYYQAYGFEHLLYAEKHLAVEKKIDKMAHIDELVDFLNNEYTALFSGISKLTDYSMPIRNAAQYIESNYRTIEGLIEVAMYVNLNPEYFSRLFKKETGENFNNYLNDCRLENSIDLLLNSNKKLYHIAEEVGFSSLSYYSKKFKDRYGINPFTYRSTSGKADDDYKK